MLPGAGILRRTKPTLQHNPSTFTSLTTDAGNLPTPSVEVCKAAWSVKQFADNFRNLRTKVFTNSP